MLKHTEILNKMSAKQKISLIANISCLADDEFVALGIPRVKFVTLDELFDKYSDGLTPYVLSRTWNPDLISEVTEKTIERFCGDANAIIVPSPKINLGGEAERALSEDPLLATQISLAFLSAVNKCNKTAIIPDFCLTRKEVANMDIEPDKTALNDFIYKPFSSVAARGNVKAVIGSLSKNDGAYESFNRSLIRHKDDYFSSETRMLCICRTYDETLAALEENCIIFAGVEIAIQNAYDQYLTLLSAIEKGRASVLNLEEAFEHKTAISDQMLDIAADKVIDFALSINPIVENINTGAELEVEPIQPSEAANDKEELANPPADTTEANDSSDAESSETEQASDVEPDTQADHAPETELVDESNTSDSESPAENATQEERESEASEPAPDEVVEEISVKADEPIETNVSESSTTPPVDEEYENLLTLAIEKSTVLLKNNDYALPLDESETFAIIGDVAATLEKGQDASFAKYFTEFAPNNCIGTERGYDYIEDRSDSLIASAVALAKQASTVLVFLKAHKSKNSVYPLTSLPANQTALINALSQCKCKIIAIVSSDTNIDVSFGDSVDGLVLAPIAGKASAKALANVIFGKASVGGQLTTSFYTSPQKFYKKQRFYKDNGRNKVSLFVGYRFYDTQDIPITYPFGFGLKYSEIEISNTRWNSGSISFTATNVGDSDVDETIEIYLGLDKSNLLRPQKELIAYYPIHLDAGRSENVTIKDLNFKIYDASSNSNIVESGNYTIYIGTSVSDILATISANVYGKTITTPKPQLSDYLQAQTNIISNNYTLEAKHKRMANYKSLKNAGFTCLLVAILVALMSTSVESPLIPIIIGAIISLVSIALLVASHNLKNRVKQEEAELIEKNKTMFENADSTATEKLEDLFQKEFKFDVTDFSAMIEEVDEILTDAGTAMFNESMSFALAASDFKKSAEEFGVIIDGYCSANVIASFASSRLIIAKTVEKDKLDGFVDAVSNYFGASLFTETITEAHSTADRLLRKTSADGVTSSTEVLNALLSANEKPRVMHIIYLKGLQVSKISEYLTPYIKYFSAPRSEAKISAKGSDDVYTIPSNVWFITELEKDMLVENIPAYISEYSALLPVKYAECPPAEEKSDFVPITPIDFEFLSARCRTKFVLNEDIWKKIDAIESFVFKHASYKIGNKLWLRIENYITTLLSIETELPIAIDSTLASMITPTLASVLAGKLDDTDKSLIEEIERIFGEDNVQITHEMLVSKA